MKFCSKEYMSKLFKFSNEFEGINMRFKDEAIEQKYCDSNKENEEKKSLIFSMFSLLFYILALFVNLFIVSFHPNRSTYMVIGGLIFDLILLLNSRKCKLKPNLVLIQKYFRFLLLYFIGFLINMFPIIKPNPDSCTQSRILLTFILLISLLYLYYLDFNIIILILIPIFNCLLILFIQYNFDFPPFYFTFEFVGNIVYYILTIFNKKFDTLNKRKVFFESFKNEEYIEYINQLINALNTIVISVQNNDVLFMNNFAISYFKNKKNFKVIENIQENERLISNVSNKNNDDPVSIHTYMNSFFQSLILDKPLENQSLQFSQGKSLKEIISEILSSHNTDSKEFTKIGYFNSLNESNFFEVYVRKLKLKEEVVELLINDITEIKLVEERETKYKQKILAKIAHEFKTPLISIISLIQKTITYQSEIKPSIKKNLDHINNLSNYTLVLISDIIQYVSNSIKLVLNKHEIILNEVLEFSFNVLKTLVECNENKRNKIQTEMEIDENINKLTDFTDEGRLKQILLNLISNSFKFTVSGFIKIKAKYNILNHSIEIFVEDTGLGIKSEDHHLIFQDYVQLNLEKEYNRNGS